ncbi:MAG: PAS domain-containing protein, partial [Chlorobi bacterium]|nr:PAS domain-containing protein [Chlorobiota bacterium]
MHIGSFETDKKLKITFVSRGLKYFIPSPETLIGSGIKDVFRTANRDIIELLPQVFKGLSFEKRLLFTFPAGRVGEVRFSGTPLTDRENVVSSALFVFLEIPHNAGIDIGWEQTQINLLSLLENNPVGLVVLDLNRTIRYLNPAAEIILSKTQQELIHKKYSWPVSKERLREIDILHTDGSLSIAETEAIPFVWEELPALIVTLRDITGEKMIRDGIFNVIADAIVFLDNLGKPHYYNRRFSKLFQIKKSSSDAEPVITQIGKYFRKEDHFVKKAKHLMKSDDVLFETLYHTQGWVFEWFSKPVFLHRKKIGRVMSFHDISRQKITEKQIRRQNRLYATLSKINQTLVRTKSISEMVRE